MALTAMAWIALATIWGTTFLAIRVGLNTLPPITFAGMRFVLGAVLLGVTVRPRGIPLPQSRSAGIGARAFGAGAGVGVEVTREQRNEGRGSSPFARSPGSAIDGT